MADSRRDELRRKLRQSGNSLPRHEEKLARAVFGVPDETLSHDQCIAALPDYVDAVIEGVRVAEKFPRVKWHLDSCAACTALYVGLLEGSLADLKDEHPLPEAIPEPDLSFLPSPREQKPSAGRRVQEVLTAIEAQLRDLTLFNNVAIPAHAKSVEHIVEDGETKDGSLRWRIVEDDDQNLVIRFGSHVLELEGVHLRLKAGMWQREVVLTRVTPDQVGAEIGLTQEERSGAPSEEVIPLTIEFASAP
jgi:hypothetical protein